MTDYALTKRFTRHFTGWHMLFLMIGFFGVVFAVNGILVYSALHSWTGLVVENSYVASQSFNADTAHLVAARQGINHVLHYQDGQLRLQLTGSDGKPLEASDVKIELGRPVADAQDQTLVLVSESTGNYFATANLQNGVWRGMISGRVAGKPDIILPFRLIVEAAK